LPCSFWSNQIRLIAGKRENRRSLIIPVFLLATRVASKILIAGAVKTALFFAVNSLEKLFLLFAALQKICEIAILEI